MKISVVIVSYNQEAFLERTLQSVCSQDYENKEIVVIDQGTDNSVEIIRRYERHLAFWVRQPNTGQTAAIMYGFGRCTGEIVGWVNSDDLLHPGALRHVAAAASRLGTADAVFVGGAYTIDEHDRPQDRFEYGRFNTFIANRLGPVVCQPGTFWGKRVFDSLGGLDVSLKYGMDYDLFCRFLRAGVPFVYSGAIHAEFRKHSRQKGHATSYWATALAEGEATRRRYGFDKVSRLQKLIARGMLVTTRIFNGYYLSTYSFRLRVRHSLKEFNTEYSESAYADEVSASTPAKRV